LGLGVGFGLLVLVVGARLFVWAFGVGLLVSALCVGFSLLGFGAFSWFSAFLAWPFVLSPIRGVGLGLVSCAPFRRFASLLRPLAFPF